MNTPRYINPYTDFGFKRLFGTELNKDLLISFLNALLGGREVVTQVSYKSTERFGVSKDSRRAIFDVFCENDKGELFIVEMQNVYQQFFKDRSVFYSTFPIQEQGQVGDWDFRLRNVYTVGVLNFCFAENEYEPDNYFHEVKLMDTKDKHVFYDKLTLLYLEMPKFNKTEDQLETMFDKWLFVLRNLSRLMERPAALRERVFERVFEQAEIARYSETERREYEDSINAYRDINNAVKTAKNDGIAEGKELGIAEGIELRNVQIAKKLKEKGLSAEEIAELTDLNVEQIIAL